MFDIQDYEYDLPEELIAQVPAERRDQARLLVVDRTVGSFSDRHFSELPFLLEPGDLLVVNNTRVVPARLFGRKESGGRIEVLVLEHADSRVQKSNTRWCLAKSAKKPRKGSRLAFEQEVSGFIEDVGQDGLTLIRFESTFSRDSEPIEKGRTYSKNSKPIGKGPLFSNGLKPREKGPLASRDSKPKEKGPFSSRNLEPKEKGPFFSIDRYLEEKGAQPFSIDKFLEEKGPPFSIDQYLEEKGTMPLPPYIKRERQNGRSALDRERYQTIFSQKKGAVAAPTAGLHFTNALVEKLNQAGVSMVELTLHVGHGTFKPVRTRDIRRHELGEEAYVIDPMTAETINRVKKAGKRIIAVGTTVVRTLETAVGPDGEVTAGEGETALFITPGFRFRVIDGMVTNFHLPRSSLLFLVSAFAGLQLTQKAYRWAVTEKYRFYSYGDAMLIL